mmetsp:Transcript_85287/g.198287  ORF Transcript_85287/g.198287 Transcript_85287/m.198287 type:complete len:241 (+) Transcript_85287:252-974(+)
MALPRLDVSVLLLTQRLADDLHHVVQALAERGLCVLLGVCQHNHAAVVQAHRDLENVGRKQPGADRHSLAHLNLLFLFPVRGPHLRLGMLVGLLAVEILGDLQVNLHVANQVLEVLKGEHDLLLDGLARVALLVQVLVAGEVRDNVQGVGDTAFRQGRLGHDLRLLLLFHLEDSRQVAAGLESALPLLPCGARRSDSEVVAWKELHEHERHRSTRKQWATVLHGGNNGLTHKGRLGLEAT